MICCVIGSIVVLWFFRVYRKLKSNFVKTVAENHAEQWQLYPDNISEAKN